ncbi:MAG: sulfur carrier protein ThiS adenylyltransferase ThiF [Spirochaetales bacterium]|nr:sulfur carrier protein ThiS adenylyltransferase ThiF [Spirochaetales bacterium]
MSKKIGIAGCGGIGSNVALNLVRRGYTDFVLADFDKIEESNLNRQFFFKDQIGSSKVMTLKANLLRINPELNIETHDVRLEPGNIREIFGGCEIIVEGLDQRETKSMFFENIMGLHGLAAYVGASGIAGNNPELVSIKRLNAKCYICGDFVSDIEDYEVTSAKVVTVAAFMASVVDRFCVGGLDGVV